MQVEIMNDVLTKVGQEEEIQYIFYLTFKKIYQSIWHILFHIYMYMYIYELVISVCVCVCVWSYCSIKQGILVYIKKIHRENASANKNVRSPPTLNTFYLHVLRGDIYSTIDH